MALLYSTSAAPSGYANPVIGSEQVEVITPTTNPVAGGLELPVLLFDLDGGRKVTWWFATENERDSALEDIVDIANGAGGGGGGGGGGAVVLPNPYDLAASSQVFYSPSGAAALTLQNAELNLSDGLGIRRNVVFSDESLELTAANDIVIFENGKGSVQTMWLPKAGDNTGKTFTIKMKECANPTLGVSIAPSEVGETIDGEPTYDLTSSYQAITVVSQGGNWHVIHRVA